MSASHRIKIGAVWIDPLRMSEAVDTIEALAGTGKGGTVFTPNVDHVVMAEHDADFRSAYDRASLSLVDGKPVLWAASLLGTPLPEKVSGSDLFEPLMERAAIRSLRVALVGGMPGVAERAAERLRERHPGLTIVATLAPKIAREDTPEERQCVEAIAAARPDLVMVCFGAPKQELFCERNRERLAPAVLVCVGAAIDFAAGTARRAPSWVSAAGLEWLYRLVREPRRLAARYLLRDPEFAAILARQWFARSV